MNKKAPNTKIKTVAVKKLLDKSSIKTSKLKLPKIKPSAAKSSKTRGNALVNDPVQAPVKNSVVLVKKRKKKTASKMYFTQETEDAIIEYNKQPDSDIREHIYRTKIEYPFKKLVENVFNRFGFTYFRTGSNEVQREALAHLVSNLGKYDPDRTSKLHGKNKKSKAFSYFSVIAKNWFILLNNNTYKEFQSHVEISEEKGEHTVQLQHVDKHHAQTELDEFLVLTIQFWEQNIENVFSKQRDLNIAYAVLELLRNSHRIDSFNKKALYLYIRDISDCKTQQITKVINKMRQYYRNIHQEYLNTGTVDIL